jgi:SAM-dependent methyltransferase
MTDDKKSCAALSAEELKAHVRRVYSLAAGGPQADLPFPVGREFAQAIGYPAGLLDSLPEECVASFAGIYPLSLAAELEPGQGVLDVGCGAGLDALIAARRTSPGGRVVGVDFSEAMVARAKAAAAEANLPVEFQVCEAGRLPFPEASFDVVLANGVLNLNPDRKKLLSEMARVLKGGGRLYVAEIVSEGEEPAGPCTLADWFR